MKPAVKWTLIAGIICTLCAPFAGLIFTVVGMIGAFHSLGQNGISDPHVLSTRIGEALVATMTGLIVGVIFGVPLILAAVIFHFATKPRPPATHL
jgi:biopolymer transport protein ExbB/TolQ